jgi:hypothetical protein
VRARSARPPPRAGPARRRPLPTAFTTAPPARPLARSPAASRCANDPPTTSRCSTARLPSCRPMSPRTLRSCCAATRPAPLTSCWKRDARIRFSVGFDLTEPVRRAILSLDEDAWTPALDAHGDPRDNGQITEITTAWTCRAGPNRERGWRRPDSEKVRRGALAALQRPRARRRHPRRQAVQGRDPGPRPAPDTRREGRRLTIFTPTASTTLDNCSTSRTDSRITSACSSRSTCPASPTTGGDGLGGEHSA